jgi:hypothetical protein
VIPSLAAADDPAAWFGAFAESVGLHDADGDIPLGDQDDAR